MTAKETGYFARVSLAFARLGDTYLLAFVRNVLTLMLNNVSFKNPLPTLDLVTAAADAFEAAIQVALDGGKLAIATRNAARSSLLSLMRQLAAFVTNACNEDLVVLLSSGFEAVKAPSPAGVLDAPENGTLSYTGTSGELLLKFDRVDNAYGYSIETAPSPDGPWTHEMVSTQARTLIDDLTVGKPVWVRYCANGSAGPSGYGGPLTAIVV